MRSGSNWRGRSIGAGTAAAVLLALGGCAGPVPMPTVSLPPNPSSSPPATPPPAFVQPEGEPAVVATDLDAPWSVVRLESGSALISERDTALIKELTADGEVREVGTIDGVDPGGEGGLLGIEAWAEGDATWLYAYFTSSSDNRIVRMPLEGEAGAYSLGAADEILTGLAKAGNHNGGRIKIGPDDLLYATVGDAGQRNLAQDQGSLNGKILRMGLDGTVPDDNPFPGSLVYTLGHRNPQGLAWGEDGTLYSSEFGQNAWDELNIISAGENYGWPEAEGIADVDGYVNPIHQWSTAEASPSGLASVSNTLVMAALRGQRLWSIYVSPESVEAIASYEGEFGRLRDAIPGPDGTLWVLTNNTDGRGSPVEDDDKLLEIRLTERPAG